ncbi:MAG: argininosuccinate lyase [Saprospiraceae bacterium]|nr:argininosuccinate lyase [Saprospiraceae bacterium]
MKLWDKNNTTDDLVEAFTVGQDRALDLLLAPYDALASIAHVMMLDEVGLLDKAEAKSIVKELQQIYKDAIAGRFVIEDGSEDVHSQIELLLTRILGETGKKVHAGRSRNDQVLVALKLFYRHEIEEIVKRTKMLFDELMSLSEKHKHDLMPGYTHMQVAMVSSFGLWFGAYAESLADDLRSMQASFQMVNLNPLGSAAGYGSSFPLNRTMTTQALGFNDLHYNVINAQMSRGKTELVLSQSMAVLASTINKLAMDMCLYIGQDFGFISFPDELTTGSSIMPHKKNPDVWELIRSHCNRILALPGEISMMIHNLPAGYHRDFQLLKEVLFPMLQSLKSVLDIAAFMLPQIKVASHLVQKDKYQYLFTVEEVNKLVLSGVAFRDAYKQVGLKIQEGNYKPDYHIHHTHEGSIGHLCHAEINAKMESVLYTFDFDGILEKEQALLAEK